MTGFIKPSELLAAQEAIVEHLDGSEDDFMDLDEEVRAFMEIHPVTKEKEVAHFRKVDGVFITEESYEEAERRKRPLDEYMGGV